MFLRPRTLDEAVAALGAPGVQILAGGTDFFPALGERQVATPVVDITAIPELSGITVGDGEIRIAGGTTWTLTQLLGPRRALEFVLLNEAVTAQTALRLGLVNRVVPNAELMEAVRAMAAKLARGSVGAQGASKALVQAATHGTFDAQLDLEKQAFVVNAGTAGFREGIAAFFERRPPRF